MKLTIAWGAPSAGVAKRMRMAWCLRAAGVRGNTKGSSSALSELMRMNNLRITLHSPMCDRCDALQLFPLRQPQSRSSSTFLLYCSREKTDHPYHSCMGVGQL
eukprot:scaffold6516_cov126-Isochrysis_galbana.AAC.1